MFILIKNIQIHSIYKKYKSRFNYRLAQVNRENIKSELQITKQYPQFYFVLFDGEAFESNGVLR